MKIVEFPLNESQTEAYKQRIIKAIQESKTFVAVTFDADRVLHYWPFNIRHDQAIFAMEFAKQEVWRQIYGEEDENS